MRIDDYTPPTTFATEHAPRERAAQDTARKHRARTSKLQIANSDEGRRTKDEGLPIPPRIIIAVVMLPLLAALAFLWPSSPPLQSAPEPTPAPALAAPTPVPVASPTIVPTAAPAPTQPATAHVDTVPPAGRGLTIAPVVPAEMAKPIEDAAPVELPVIATQAAGAIARPGLGQCLHGQTFTDQGCKNLGRAHEKIVGTP